MVLKPKVGHGLTRINMNVEALSNKTIVAKQVIHKTM